MVASSGEAALAEVEAVLDGRVEASRARDIDRLMALYAPGIVYFDIIPPHQFTGTDEVRRNFLRWFAEYQGDIGLETHDLSVAVTDGVAFAHMLHPDSGTRRSGEDITVWVRATVCLQRIDDQWLITHEHVSFPINPQEWSAVVDAAPQPESGTSPPEAVPAAFAEPASLLACHGPHVHSREPHGSHRGKPTSVQGGPCRAPDQDVPGLSVLA